MRAAWVIAKREMLAFFVSPMAYVVLLAWMLWSGLQYWMLCAYFAQSVSRAGSENPLAHFFGGTTLFFMPLLVFVPVMTMRLLAEERRSGTLECLLTAPVTDVQVVLGKYLAAMVFWLALWAPTSMYVWITSRYGEIDLGAVGSSYLGILGIGLYYMAIGTLMSAASRNQIVAAILTFMVLGFLFLVGILEFVFQDSEYRPVFTYVSVWGHMDAFSRGIVDTRFLVFDVSTAVLALYLAVRALASRKGA